MDSSFFEGAFDGDANIAEPSVDETVTMVDGPLPEDRDPSFWTLYEKDWFKYVSEKDVFSALLRHVDGDGKKDWEIGIGRGGQLYSWRGPWGEAMPPQAAPWMDEVWQATVHCPYVQKVLNAIYEHDAEQSNGTNSVGQAFVHGSGCSNKYGAAGDEPYTMFYCPKLASWYDAENKAYAIINWGQSSTQPTIFPHRILYYSRYRYLGNGVLEVSNIVYNFGDYDYGYNGTPWGGVRATTFPEIFWSNDDSSYFFNDRLIRFGRDGAYRPPLETDGWLGAAARRDDPESPAFGFAFGRSVGSCCVGSAGHGPPRDYIVMASNPAGFSPEATLSAGESFWTRYYLMVGSFEDVVRNARAYSEKAGWGDLDLPERTASTQLLYRTTLDDGTVSLSRSAVEGAKPVCGVYNEPVLGATPLFVIREIPTGRSVVTTDPYALSRTEPYPNPLPEDHEHHAQLQGAVKRYTYESDGRKKLGWELLGFVMPKAKARGDRTGYVALNTVVDGRGTQDMLALSPGGSSNAGGGVTAGPGAAVPQTHRYRYKELEVKAQVLANEVFTVRCTGTNTGGTKGVVALEFTIDDRYADTRKLRLDSGETGAVELSTAIFELGEHEIRVGDLPPKGIRVIPRPPTFSYSKLHADALAGVGDEIGITATVTNMGSGAGIVRTNLVVDGRIADTKDVTVPAGPGGASATVRFPHRFEQAGNYQVTIDQLPPITVTVAGPLREPHLAFTNCGARMLSAGERVVIRANKSDTWTRDDAYGAIVGEEVTGDFSAVVKVEHQENSNPNVKAGLIVRNDITKPGESTGYVTMILTPQWRYLFLWDSDANGFLDRAAQVDKNEISFPVWLKLEKKGKRFTGYYSEDGVEWRQVGSVEVPSAGDAQHVGIHAASGDNEKLYWAKFSEFEVNAPGEMKTGSVPYPED